MRLRAAHYFLLCAVTLVACAAAGQLTVDATGPYKAPDFGILGGVGGSPGRKLPVQLTVEREGTAFNAGDGRTVIAFVLTNVGKQALTIPISVNGEDVATTNSFHELAFSLEFGNRDDIRTKGLKLLQVGADRNHTFVMLFGSDAIPSTLATLAPGQFLRVRAEIAIPQTSEDENTKTVFVAGAMMSDDKITTVRGKRLMDSQEVGSATSREYTPQELLRAPQ